MFIAFEGPDNTGKSTSANNLDIRGEATYNVTKEKHAAVDRDSTSEPDTVICYDRIDWLTHMIYRLALPEKEWNDARARTVFAMPDTHLVFKLHTPHLIDFISDELYHPGQLARVNPMYYYHADFIMNLNRRLDYSLFKTVSIIEVSNDPRDGTFFQRLVEFDSPVFEWGTVSHKTFRDDESLLELLRYEEQQRI